MMKKTASIHVTLDYHDEQDFAEKMHLALRLIPVTTAMFANSPIAEGKLTGLLSTRAHIWQHTDPARCGMISEAFFRRPSFSAYVDYALDVPMLFIVRSNRWMKSCQCGSACTSSKKQRTVSLSRFCGWSTK